MPCVFGFWDGVRELESGICKWSYICWRKWSYVSRTGLALVWLEIKWGLDLHGSILI